MEVDLRGVKVFIALPTHRDFLPDFVVSFASTLQAFQQFGIQWTMHMVKDRPLAYARSILCDQFLKTDCTHLLWLDSDMSWTADDILRLTALATKMDIIATPCVGRADNSPVMFKPFAIAAAYNEWRCIPVQRTGFAVCYMSRNLVQKMSDRCTKEMRVDSGAPLFKDLFQFDRQDGTDCITEDFAFCDDLRAEGFSIFIDPMTTPGHIGYKTWRAPKGLTNA